MQSLITIKEIVADIMLDMDDQSNGQFLRATRFIERGIGELKLFHAKMTTPVKLNINYDTLTAPLPSDYVRYVEIGVYNNHGQLIPLTINDKLINVQAKSCDSDKADEVEYIDTSNRYGHKGGLSEFKECRINLEKHRIEFSTNLKGYDVYLKYISTGVDSNTLIPVIYRESLIAYGRWKLEKNPNLRDYLKREYYEEVEKLRDAQSPTLQELYDAVLQSSNQIGTR